MADPIATAKGIFSGIDFTKWISLSAVFIIFIIFVCICGVITFFIIRNMRYNRKIIIFEKIAGRFEPTSNDKAIEVRIGESGDSVFYTRKYKKYLPTPTIQTGKRTYWYFIRQDGEWINFGPGDFDNQMRSLNANFLDKEMRYARVALQRNLKERYMKPSFLSVYGGLIAYVGLIIVTGIMMYLLFGKYLEISKSVESAVAAAQKVQDSTNNILTSLDNIVSNGGLKPASFILSWLY